MRRAVAVSTLVSSSLVLSIALLPAQAEAHPYPLLRASFMQEAEPAQPDGVAQPAESAQPEGNPNWQPTSSKAPPCP